MRLESASRRNSLKAIFVVKSTEDRLRGNAMTVRNPALLQSVRNNRPPSGPSCDTAANRTALLRSFAVKHPQRCRSRTHIGEAQVVTRHSQRTPLTTYKSDEPRA